MQNWKVKIVDRTLEFKFVAGTSRGSLTEHQVNYLILEKSGVRGIGEIAPLPKLSIDYGKDFESILSTINWPKSLTSQEEVFEFVKTLNLSSYPSLAFAIETALLDYLHGGNHKIFDCALLNKEEQIPINGLVWMNSKEHMLGQVKTKIEEGFTCIKMKIGAINLDDELDILAFIREKYPKEKLILRVDANGAFDYNQSKEVLKKLQELGIHSIEQPMSVGHICEMRTLSKYNSVGVALDEELIGIHTFEDKQRLVEEIQPNYLILKPTLLGGLNSCLEWIEIAQKQEIDWWLTSALESNVGLNAVTQFASYLEVENYQGLGTGKLYHNNIDSPLEINNGMIGYDPQKKWGSIEEL